MATWITHMRIAEHFIKSKGLNPIDFLVGNIGPDCGVPNEDWSKFTPDTNVTHWKLDGNNIDANNFKNKFLSNEIKDFYLGYYFHLLTDIEWSRFVDKKKLEHIYYEGFNKDKNFIWVVKKDWYGQDHIFLQNNPNFIFFTVFAKIKQYDNIYLDIYPKEAFTIRIKYITDFYNNAKEDDKREFPYLKKNEMDFFVKDTISILENVYNGIIEKSKFNFA